MTEKKDVDSYLKNFKIKMRIYDILFLDNRGKNQQALHDLELTPSMRRQYISALKVEDYSEGPLEEKMHGILPMWVFGKLIKGKEVYIKISMGQEKSSTICISFHVAEHSMNYPFKT